MVAKITRYILLLALAASLWSFGSHILLTVFGYTEYATTALKISVFSFSILVFVFPFFAFWALKD